MGRKLYVGNLGYGLTDQDLTQLFAAHGTVESAQVVMDRDTGRSKGFGFVEMKTDQEAQAVIAGLNGQMSGGRSLTVRREPEPLLEVGHHGADVEPRIFGRQRLPRGGQRGLADVDRHVAAQRARVAQRVEQQPGLVRRPGAELDQRPRAGLRRDPGRVRAQDLPLGASRVVLRQFGDLVEQRAALRVIEPLGRQRLRFRGEPGPGVGAECFLEEAGR